jgi:hypothetical protein
MGNISSQPQRLGAGLVAADSAALALLDPDGLTIGSRCWNDDVGAYFALTVSTAGLSADIVAVHGVLGVRWIKAAAEPGTVASVVGETSNAVDNSDATNPIILDATNANAGTMSAADKAFIDAVAAAVTAAQVANGRLVVAYTTAVVDLTSTGTTDVVMPAVTGKLFHMLAARIEVFTRDAALDTDPLVYDITQNGTSVIDALQTVPFATINALAAPATFASTARVAGIKEVDTTTHPLQFKITTPVQGSGLSDCTGAMIIHGWFDN